jgi:hypothetical protein
VTELEGSAASIGAGGAGGSGKAVRGQASIAGNESASKETQAALGEIAGSAKGPSLSGSQGAASAKSGSGNGGPVGGRGSDGARGVGGTGSGSPISGLSFDGSQRKLLYPAKPAIALPENLARLVDSNRTVTVTFTVLADGSVPPGNISFTPSAILPAEIRDYLRREFSTWRFEKSVEDGQARFLYSIRVE